MFGTDFPCVSRHSPSSDASNEGNVEMTDFALRNPLRTGINPLFQPEVPAAPQGISAKNVKASEGMMSGSELIARMGGKPTFNVSIFGKVLKSNSEAYKGALEGLQNYQLRCDDLKWNFKDVTPGEMAALKGELHGVINQADAYHTKHATSDSKADRRGVMADLKAMAQAELANLDRLGTLRNTDGKTITVSDGLALLRGGVTDCSSFSTALNDSRIDVANSKDNFGAGKVNSVSLLAYGTDMRVVKAVSKEASKLMAGEAATGFDQKNMRTAARNIASAVMAERMGIGPSIPKPDIVIHNGEASLAMRKAPGESLIYKFDAPVTKPEDIQRYDTELAKGWHENLNQYGVHKDDNGVWQKKTFGLKDIPYTGTGNPQLTASIQRGLLDLQALDCLMAQMDRQPENIYIQITGNTAQITGIDNDMCLGKEMKHITELDTGKPLRDDLKSTYGAPPPLMSRDMFNKINALTADAFKAALGPEFTADEKSAAASRLGKLKEHAAALDTAGCIVDDFRTWKTRDGSMDASQYLMSAAENSYVKRDVTTQLKSRAPLLPLDLTKH
jgi:hypothetical protein